jgi:hypothetical protein
MPSNMALQRTRRPSLRSGRSLRSLGSPLNARPLARAKVSTRRCVLALIGATLVSACSGRSKSVAQLPVELAVPETAQDVAVREESGAVVVRYRLPMQYPAEEFLADVRARLEKRGWRPQAMDLLNPTIRSSHLRGWTHFFDATVSPRAGVHQWLADWRNDSGDVVVYALRYSAPAGEAWREVPSPATAVLEVSASLIPAELAKALVAGATAQRTARP